MHGTNTHQVHKEVSFKNANPQHVAGYDELFQTQGCSVFSERKIQFASHV
jgi:hypothetical protein